MSLLAEVEIRDPNSQITDVPHNYVTIKIGGVKNCFGAGSHYVFSVERCRICKTVKITEHRTNQWYEVENEISS